MDLLRINEQEGQFLKNGVWIPICDIERDDLLELSGLQQVTTMSDLSNAMGTPRSGILSL